MRYLIRITGHIKILGITLLLTVSHSAHAQKLPLWEIGVGLGALYLPFYRGASQTKTYALPYPYLVYRGKYLEIDAGSVRGHLFETKRTLLDLSLAAGIPVPSDEDGARVGMPRLDPTLELGPSLEVHLWHHKMKRRSLTLNFPLRSSFSVSLDHIAQQGWSFSPYLEYAIKSSRHGDWKASLALGPLYADSDYHNYYYQVDAGYASASRPEYNASGGYSGSRVTFTVTKNIGDLWLGGFIRYDDLDGAVFKDSPLVTEGSYMAMGVALTWVFAKSETLVEVSD